MTVLTDIWLQFHSFQRAQPSGARRQAGSLPALTDPLHAHCSGGRGAARAEVSSLEVSSLWVSNDTEVTGRKVLSCKLLAQKANIFHKAPQNGDDQTWTELPTARKASQFYILRYNSTIRCYLLAKQRFQVLTMK